MGRAKTTGRAAVTPKLTDAILKAMARKALEGATRAAQLVLEYGRAAVEGQSTIEACNAQILSLAELINNPRPTRTLADIEGGNI